MRGWAAEKGGAMRVAILMPTFNEPGVAQALASVRARAEELGGVRVFLVDDGSTSPVDPHALPSRTPWFTIDLARHVVNLGQGAALETARQMALQMTTGTSACRAYVTMDSDGQHRAGDIAALVQAIDDGADVAFGNRFAGESNVPALKRIVLHAARAFEGAITGVALADAHNGFRAFGQDAIARVSIHQNGMAHATELRVQVARAKLRITEVPVSIRYTRATAARGQSPLGAFAILRDLLHRYLFEESK